MSHSSVRWSALGSALAIGAVLVATASTPARASDIETAGEVLRFVLPVAAGGVALAKDDSDGLIQLGLSIAGSFGTAFLLQSFVEKRRPDGSDTNSFPSDSAAIAFSAAAFLERRYGWDYGIPAYAGAAFVGYSRVDADRHDWADVLTGAVIGWAFSALIASSHDDNIQVSGAAGGTPLGFRVQMAW